MEYAVHNAAQPEDYDAERRRRRMVTVAVGGGLVCACLVFCATSRFVRVHTLLWIIDSSTYPARSEHCASLFRLSEKTDPTQWQNRIMWSRLGFPGPPKLCYVGRLTSTMLVANVSVPQQGTAYMVLLRVGPDGEIYAERILESKLTG